jgi:hypothetical protein
LFVHEGIEGIKSNELLMKSKYPLKKYSFVGIGRVAV